MTPISTSIKQEPLFDLIKIMSKAEKRNFKLYATRLQGNQDAKFIQLFDTLESLEAYDEAKILSRCPVKKSQLANLKAHLYRQILISIRMLETQHVLPMRIRELLDFAHILYERGLPKQASKMLDKVTDMALEHEFHSTAIDILDLSQKLEMISLTHNRTSEAEAIGRKISTLSNTIGNTSHMAHTSLQLYGLHLKLGYARSDKDLALIQQTFSKRLNRRNVDNMSFTERSHYYEACVWFHYIQHEFVKCYRYACHWVELYHNSPEMKILRYNDYIHGYASILDGLFLMQEYKRFNQTLLDLKSEKSLLCSISNNASHLYHQVEYINSINLHFFRGSFKDAVELLPEIEQFISDSENRGNIHDQMLLRYKIACCYFGNGDYLLCMQHLSPLISTRDPQVRRDLQCFARILNFICCFESGIDYNLDYHIRSVYTFLVKMNDMNIIAQEMIAFVKSLGKIPASEFKNELTKLYNKLLPYAGSNSYISRTFYYLDVITWLESKISGRSMASIMSSNFERSQNLPESR